LACSSPDCFKQPQQGDYVMLFFLFLLSLAEVFQFLRQNSLIMAITKAGKQLYKFDTQVLVRISAEAGFFLKKKLRLKCDGEQTGNSFIAVAHLAFPVADFQKFT